MAVELDVRDDFNTILDGAEPVTLQRRGTAETIAVPIAWRFASEVRDVETGVADTARSDVVWQFSWDDAVPRPVVGDAILDASGRCWTLLSVRELGAKTRLRCLGRNLHLVYSLCDRVEIQQAIWEDDAIVGWTTLRPAVAARIQPDETTIDMQATPPTSTAAYRIVLGEELPLDHNHRIIGPDGSVYELTRYVQAERLDVLPVAVVRKVVNP